MVAAREAPTPGSACMSTPLPNLPLLLQSVSSPPVSMVLQEGWAGRLAARERRRTRIASRLREPRARARALEAVLCVHTTPDACRPRPRDAQALLESVRESRDTRSAGRAHRVAVAFGWDFRMHSKVSHKFETCAIVVGETATQVLLIVFISKRRRALHAGLSTVITADQE